MARKLTTLVIAVALVAVAAGPASPASAKAKKGKVTACVIKKGEDKGLMRFAPKGKCKKGEKKLTWNKKGKRGKAGPAGPQGPAGAAGGSGVTEQLEQTVAALCTQLATVTSQLTAVQGAVAGIGLSGTIPPLLGLTIPTMPPPLGSFGCPAP